MDRTLKRAKRNNKRRGRRNHGAWQRFAPDGIHLSLLPARRLASTCASPGQPHLLPARDGGGTIRTPWVKIYRHDPVSSTGQARFPDQSPGHGLVRRMTVANRAELITAYCVVLRREHGNRPRCSATRGTSLSER